MGGLVYLIIDTTTQIQYSHHSKKIWRKYFFFKFCLWINILDKMSDRIKEIITWKFSLSNGSYCFSSICYCFLGNKWESTFGVSLVSSMILKLSNNWSLNFSLYFIDILYWIISSRFFSSSNLNLLYFTVCNNFICSALRQNL